MNSLAEQQKWDHRSIRDPRTVYQMSLRMGVSFEALTRTLVKHKFLEPAESQRMLGIRLKDLKTDLLSGSYHPDTFHCNIWQLTEKDENATIIAEPKDLFIVRLREMSGAGYLWDFDEVRKAGYQVLLTLWVNSMSIFKSDRPSLACSRASNTGLWQHDQFVQGYAECIE